MDSSTYPRYQGAGLDDRPLNGFIVVGVLSDTHGHLYPEVLRALEGVDHIIHAGDVGGPEVLGALRAVAPVTAVRGNCDHGVWAEALPERVELTLGGTDITISHVAPRSLGPADIGQRIDNSGDIAVVVFGHSHVATVDERGQVLYLNPGSAGPRRFGRPRTVARLEILASAAKEPPGSQAHPQVRAVVLPLG